MTDKKSNGGDQPCERSRSTKDKHKLLCVALQGCKIHRFNVCVNMDRFAFVQPQVAAPGTAFVLYFSFIDIFPKNIPGMSPPELTYEYYNPLKNHLKPNFI